MQCVQFVQHVVARAVHDPRFARIDAMRAAACLPDIGVRLIEAADVDGRRVAHLHAKALMSARQLRGRVAGCRDDRGDREQRRAAAGCAAVGIERAFQIGR